MTKSGAWNGIFAENKDGVSVLFSSVCGRMEREKRGREIPDALFPFRLSYQGLFGSAKSVSEPVA